MLETTLLLIYLRPPTSAEEMTVLALPFPVFGCLRYIICDSAKNSNFILM